MIMRWLRVLPKRTSMDMLMQDLEFPCPRISASQGSSRPGGIIRWRSPRHRFYQHQRGKQMIKKNMLYTLALIVGGVLAGCAAPGPKFSGLQTVSPDSAELIVYRKSALFASGQTMPVLIDGIKSGELYNGSYLQQQLTPGRHSVEVTTGMFGKPAETTVQLAAGERKFLHFDFSTGLLANGLFIGDTLKNK